MAAATAARGLRQRRLMGTDDDATEAAATAPQWSRQVLRVRYGTIDDSHSPATVEAAVQRWWRRRRNGSACIGATATEATALR